MPRLLALLLTTVLLTALITAVGLAQDNEAGPVVVNGRLVEAVDLPGAMIDGVAAPEMARSGLNGTMALTAEEPSDKCEDAPTLALTPSNPAEGISFDVRDATEEAGDPPLSCMWGMPPRIEGFRTVWYRLAVPFSGRITLDTFSSAYDTVLGVYSGSCGALVPAYCNDDFNGFGSEITLLASAGEVYYIEVADWQPGLPDAATLNFSALLAPVVSRWEAVLAKPSNPAISRHSAVADGDKLYVVGGQTGGEGVPFVSNQLWRLSTFNDRWEQMATIPGAGYSNTTAALVNGRIYVPSGFNGNNLGYDGLHWAYDIANNSWSNVTDVPARFAWAASAVPPSNNRYYLMGGTTSTDLFDPATQARRETYVYIPDSNAWLPADPMQTARYAHTGTWLSTNNLGACVAGGLGTQAGGGFVLHTSAECYQPGLGWRYVGDMKIPRFGAGSATGPDGKWYVFGGMTVIDSRLFPVLQTEVYDPRQKTWTVLPPEFNLGGQDVGSARAFASGDVIGSALYVTGGSIFVDGEHALPLTETIELPPHSAYMPTQFGRYEGFLMPDENFSQARPLPFGFVYNGNFSNQRDFYDFFSFSIPTTQNIRIQLEVPNDNDFDLFLYGHNKLEWGRSAAPFNGEDELIEVSLEPRRYYVMVKRSFPTAQPDQGARYSLVILN